MEIVSHILFFLKVLSNTLVMTSKQGCLVVACDRGIIVCYVSFE